MFHHIDVEIYTVTASVMCSMAACTWIVVRSISKTHREAEVSFQAGYELGMDAGYKEGRRVGRPRAVSNLDDFRSESG